MKKYQDKRKEQRTRAELASVEFYINEFDPAYQFKIWDTSPSGMSILIREDSAVLEYLEKGMILEMKYYSDDRFEDSKLLKTKIVHITRSNSESLKGHYLIGLQLQ